MGRSASRVHPVAVVQVLRADCQDLLLGRPAHHDVYCDQRSAGAVIANPSPLGSWNPISGAQVATLVCPNCLSESDNEARFCNRCGKRLGADFVDADLEQRLYERIEAKLKDKWIAKDAVEKDIALNAATRMVEWGKLFGIVLGVPAAIAIAIFAFVGVKSTTDLSSIETQTETLRKSATDLAAQYKPLQDELPRLTQIAASVRGLEDRVKTVENSVAKFAPSSTLGASTQAQLSSALERYKNYLKKLGLAPKSAMTVHVLEQLPEPGYDAYIQGNDIYLQTSHAVPAKLLHEVSHDVLLLPIPGGEDAQWEYSAIEAGMANYLTGDFLDSAQIDSVDLNQRVAISATRHTFVGGQSEGGMAWGSFLWALRTQYSSAKATPAIVHAFGTLRPRVPPPNYQNVFVNALVAAGLDSSTVTTLLSP